jgi:hypothetical protein
VEKEEGNEGGIVQNREYAVSLRSSVVRVFNNGGLMRRRVLTFTLIYSNIAVQDGIS